MRKMKKINGYLVVKLNDRELREWEGTGLGSYGVIDAELYTGCLDVDRDAMEYCDADSLEVAIEQARGLESELDVEEPVSTYTIVTETDRGTQEEAVDPQLLIAGYETALETQLNHHFLPEVNPTAARQQLYGFKMALHQLGLLDSEDCFVWPDAFNPPTPEQFAHLLPEKVDWNLAKRVYSMGLVLERDCPENDCRLYLNTFRMCRELDEQVPLLSGWPRKLVLGDLQRHYIQLERMFQLNHAVREYKRGLQP